MKQFSPLEYVMIDIANHFGYDKLEWEDRIGWVKNNIDCLEDYIDQAENPILFKKGIRALDDALNKVPSGHLVSLDATASGIQIMSALAGCEEGCMNTNLIDTKVRQDVYTNMAGEMSNQTNSHITRSQLKKPVMTFFYGSTAQPKRIFGEGDQLNHFYNTMQAQLPGAFNLMGIMQAAWGSDVLEYGWTLPDGHHAGFKVMVSETKKIEVGEMNGATFSHSAYVNKPTPKGLSLAANIIHSIDGFICREMYRRCDFEMLAIHDSFWCHPNDMQKLRQTYNDIFAEHIHIRLFNDIMNQIHPEGKYNFVPMKEGLNFLFRNADYALS
jgi:DNA-directed RNA polymerase